MFTNQPVFGERFIAAMRPLVIRRAIADARRMIAEHEESVAEDYRNGHRGHYCIHGTNMWTDYDNICGGCEDDIRTAYDFARIWTADRMHQLGEAFRAYDHAVMAGAPEAVLDPMLTWVVSLNTKWTARTTRRPLKNAGV